MKENNKIKPIKINTMEVNNHIINIYARPFMFEGSREVYAATITTKAGYHKGVIKWNAGLASTTQAAMEVAYQ